MNTRPKSAYYDVYPDEIPFNLMRHKASACKLTKMFLSQRRYLLECSA